LEWLHDHLLKHAKNNGYITEVKNLTDVKLLWIGKLHDEGKSRKEIADELAMIRDHYDYPFIEISTDLGRYVRERLTSGAIRYCKYIDAGGSDQLFRSNGLLRCVWLPTFCLL